MSKLFALEAPDWLKAILVAVLSSPISIVYAWANGSQNVLDWNAVLKTAVAGGLAYLIKNFFTGSGGQLLTNSNKQPPAPKAP